MNGEKRSVRLLSKPSSKQPSKTRKSLRISSKFQTQKKTIKTNTTTDECEDENDVVNVGKISPAELIDLTESHKKKEKARKIKMELFTTRRCILDLSNSDESVSSEESSFEVEKSSVCFKKPEINQGQTPRKEKSPAEPGEKCSVTPPKQRKVEHENNENTPKTPPLTPSVMLENLSINGSTERKNRKKLFQENDLYQNARRALHSTCPSDMPGRKKELNDLKEFILKHLNHGTSGTLYISGPPGTGKTASLNLIMQDEKISCEFHNIFINCTAIKSSNSVFSRITKELGIKSNGKTEKDHINAIRNYLKKSHKTILLILDEIDQLESKNQSILYTIFEWPAIPNSKLILIGIANALDLTDRILPRLQIRCELKPELMHFAPYSKQQIIEIFTDRLKNAGALDIFSPVALQMLAGKVAAISGDVRRALDIGRRVLNLVDRKKNGDCILKSVENLAEELTQNKTQTVDLKEVMNVLNNVYGTTQNLDEEIDDSFPLQQKIIICSLLLVLKKAKNKDLNLGRLHEVYRKVCMKRNIQVVDQGEFVGLCSLIETRGIVKIIKKKDPRMSKISLVWDEEEVAAALRDKQLISTILQDDNCLGKL